MTLGAFWSGHFSLTSPGSCRVDPRNQHVASTKANPPWNESRVGSRCEETREATKWECDWGMRGIIVDGQMSLQKDWQT